MPNLPLTDDEFSALTTLLRHTIQNDRYPLAPRLRPYQAILAKLDPPNEQRIEIPKPSPRPYEPSHYLTRKKRRR
jgi:hypothetical protein